MEGSGITNYRTDKPTFAFSAATTEFDDALIKHGVINHTHAIVAKGASVEEAERLTAATKTSSLEPTKVVDTITGNNPPEDNSDDDEDYLDDEFLQQYREQRLSEIMASTESAKTDALPRYGEVVIINRQEWSREVNEDSKRVWVVICLTSSDTERTGLVERSVKELAQEYPGTKFILIPSKSAIPNWPDENLPSLFLYRDGTMQTQLVQLEPTIEKDDLERMLGENGVSLT